MFFLAKALILILEPIHKEGHYFPLVNGQQELIAPLYGQ
jgi:hypothetical protein